VSLYSRNDIAKPGRKFAFKQIAFSLLVVILCTITTYFYFGILSAKSILIGGLVVIIPNVYFALKAFRYAGARSSEKVLESFYDGEKMKILLTAILTALALKFFPIEPIVFFTSFSLVVALPLLTPFLFKL
jgi:ATP synthase protein I